VPVNGQVEVDEHEQILAWVAAIDIAKASGMVCVRVPHDPQAGKRLPTGWEVRSTTTALLELGDQLAGSGHRAGRGGVHLGLLAAVGRPAGGVGVDRVAGQCPRRHAPAGPAQDRQAGCGLAGQPERAGRLRPWFVPPAQIRRLRDLPRLRADLTADRSRHQQRLEQLPGGRPEQAGNRGHRQLRGLRPGHAGGDDRRATRPAPLAELARGRLRVKHAALLEALTGQFSDHHARLARILRDQLDT
jgi:transposase